MAKSSKSTSNTPSTNTSSNEPTSTGKSGTTNSQDAIALLKADHREVEGWFQQYNASLSEEQKLELVRKICDALQVHTAIEEEIFYTSCRQNGVEDLLLDEAQVEHDSAKILIAEIKDQRPDSPFYDAKVSVLSEYIKHHVGEEEKSGDGIFAKARAAKLDLNALGQRLQARKQALMEQVQTSRFNPSTPRSLKVQLIQSNQQEASNMERQYERDRDDMGRFTDDDERASQGYSSRSRGRNQDDDRDGRNSSGRGGYERDDQGRFTSDEDNRSGSRSEGSGRGGFRDSRGYSEAGELGRQSRYEPRDEDNGDGNYRSGRGYSGSGDKDDYDNRRSSRSESGGRGWYGESRDDSNEGRGLSQSREDDEGGNRGGSRSGTGERGWYGDSRGHSEAARRGRQSREDNGDRDRGGSRSGNDERGWYGDSRGHSEAARRGWQSREDNGNRGGSRSGNDERGWYGDSRGHSEAARRGWQNRS